MESKDDTQGVARRHYLHAELLRLVRDDARVFGFLEGVLLDGMWFWDVSRPENIWLSDGFWRAVGHDPAEKEHTLDEWRALVHPDDMEWVEASARRHLEEPDHVYDETVRLIHRDGSVVWVQCRGLAIRDPDGRPLWMIGAHTDITHVKADQERLRGFVGAMPGVAFLLDDQGRYVEIMSTREAPLAGSRDELLGRRVTDVLPRETSAVMMDAIGRVLETGARETVEYRMHVPDGARWFEARVAPFSSEEPDGRPTVLWFAHDVTERRRARFALEQRNEELRRFAYVAAHDLRSPLQGIQQLACWLQEDIAEGNLTDCAQHAGLIEARVKRLQTLLTGLLEYARAAETVTLAEVETSEVVAEVLEFVRPLRPGLRFEVDPGMPALRTDRILLHQILQNLLSNAAKHHDRADGTVRVSCELRPDTALLEVADDGPGIEEQYRERVFQVFQTLKSRDEVESSGIGLAIVRKAAGALNGSVSVDARAGGGTVFRVELPR